MSKKDEYVEKMKSQLDTWNAAFAKWEAKAKEAQTELRAEHEKQLAEFYRLRDQGREKMKQVQSAAGDAWMDMTRGADEAWAKMREAFEKAHSHFKK
jgi:ElaB/YqjD/DUF883 family membrane-anchored ribosome-binding protein